METLSSFGLDNGVVHFLGSISSLLIANLELGTKGDPDCLIKTKPIDDDNFMLTIGEFCPVLRLLIG